MELLSRHISCPYCGENIELLIDDSVIYHMSMDGRYVERSQEGGAIMSMDGRYKDNAGAVVEDYFEDCSVCCRPIRIQLNIDFEGDCEVLVLRDDE